MAINTRYDKIERFVKIKFFDLVNLAFNICLKMVRKTLQVLQNCKDFKLCLAILGRHTLKG